MVLGQLDIYMQKNEGGPPTSHQMNVYLGWVRGLQIKS